LRDRIEEDELVGTYGVRKGEGKCRQGFGWERPLAAPRCTWEDKTGPEEIRREGVDQINLAQDSISFRACYSCSCPPWRFVSIGGGQLPCIFVRVNCYVKNSAV
jgi:hypothetical protein